MLAYEPGARSSLVLAIASGVLASVASIIGAVLVGGLVADVFVARGLPDDVTPRLIALGLVAIVRGLFVAGQDRLAQRAAGRLTARLRRDLTARLFALGPAYVARERSGMFAGVLTHGLEAIETSVAVFQPARALAVIVPVLVLVVVTVLDPPTVLVLLITGPVLVLLLGFIGSRANAISERRFAELRWMSALFLDLLQGLATLKAYGRSAEQAETIGDVSRRFGDTTMEVLRTAFQTALVLEWGAAVAMAVVAVEVSLRLMGQGITFERALIVLIVTPEFFLPLRTLAIRYHAGSAGRSAAEPVFAILDPTVDGGHGSAAALEPVPAALEPAPSAAPASRHPTVATSDRAATIAMDAVDFAYPDRVAALHGLSLDLAAGQLTVLAGPTGAGKSTVVALLLRFIEPASGSITVDGVPLELIDVADWRAHIGWVPQRPHLFHGTVAENMRLARPDASDDDLLRAIEHAGLSDLIEALPGGLEAPIGEDGVRLSGGQRQRLALARAILRDVPLFILDEPTRSWTR